MKRERLFSCLCGGLLAFCIAFGGTACMVTGLALEASLTALAFGCALAAAIPAACLYFKKGGRLLWAIALISGLFLTFNDGFLTQAGAMAARILDYYDRAYGMVIPEFLEGLEPASHLWPLLVIGGIVSALCCRTVCRAKGAVVCIAVACLPLASCLVVTDTVPDTLPLFLLLFGLSLLLLTQTLRRQEPARAPKLTAMLAIPLAAALMLLFFLVPQGDASVPDVTDSLDAITLWLEELFPQISTDSQGGLVIDFGNEQKQEVDLSSKGRRRERNTPVMEVTATFSDTLYLRGRSYAGYDGKTWLASEGLEEDFRLSDMWLGSNETVEVETLDVHRSLYLPYYPGGTQKLLDGRVENSDNATRYTIDVKCLVSGWQNPWKVMYGNMHSVTTPSQDVLDSALSATIYQPGASDEIYIGFIAPNVDPIYMDLPENTYQRATEILLRDVRPELGPSYTQLDMAKKIGDYVRSSAEYDLDPGRMPSGESDFAIWFLEESDKGYCVHFASAAVVLLRAAGIPARYVEGYMTKVEADETVTVREKMSHAWVEYYLNGIGWLVMDPTPGASQTPQETTAPTERPTEPTEAPTDPSDPTEPSETRPGDTAPTTEPTGPDRSEPKEPPKWLAPLLGWLAALAGTAAALWGQWYLRRRHIVRAQRRGRSNARALARWRETVRLCRLLKQQPPEELKKLAEKAKFSQHAITAEELACFTLAQQELVRQMGKKPWYLRLMYRLIFAAY